MRLFLPALLLESLNSTIALFDSGGSTSRKYKSWSVMYWPPIPTQERPVSMVLPSAEPRISIGASAVPLAVIFISTESHFPAANSKVVPCFSFAMALINSLLFSTRRIDSSA